MWIVGLTILCIQNSSARHIRDSGITRIQVPYSSSPAIASMRHSHRGERVYVPEKMQIQLMDLNTKEDLKALKSQGGHGSRESQADLTGLPVFYQPSNVNGRFNGIMYLLKY